MNIQVHADRLRGNIEMLLSQIPELKDDADLRADMLEGLTDLDEVLTTIHRLREDAKGLVDNSQRQLEDLKARKKRFGKHIDFYTLLMFDILAAADLKKRVLPECTVFVRNNPQQLIGDPDPSGVPDEFCRFKRELDRVKIREALLDGREVEGFVLNNAPPSVVVRV